MAESATCEATEAKPWSPGRYGLDPENDARLRELIRTKPFVDVAREYQVPYYEILRLAQWSGVRRARGGHAGRIDRHPESSQVLATGDPNWAAFKLGVTSRSAEKAMIRRGIPVLPPGRRFDLAAFREKFVVGDGPRNGLVELPAKGGAAPAPATAAGPPSATVTESAPARPGRPRSLDLHDPETQRIVLCELSTKAAAAFGVHRGTIHDARKRLRDRPADYGLDPAVLASYERICDAAVRAAQIAAGGACVRRDEAPFARKIDRDDPETRRILLTGTRAEAAAHFDAHEQTVSRHRAALRRGMVAGAAVSDDLTLEPSRPEAEPEGRFLPLDEEGPSPGEAPSGREAIPAAIPAADHPADLVHRPGWEGDSLCCVRLPEGPCLGQFADPAEAAAAAPALLGDGGGFEVVRFLRVEPKAPSADEALALAARASGLGDRPLAAIPAEVRDRYRRYVAPQLAGLAEEAGLARGWWRAWAVVQVAGLGGPRRPAARDAFFDG